MNGRSQIPDPMPRGVAVTMTAGIITLIATVVVVLAVFAWQPWRDDTVSSGGGIQGGGNPTPAPTEPAPEMAPP